MIPMKTLTMDSKTYEIVDDKSRRDIRRTRAPSIIQTVEGSVVVMNDSANDPLLGLKIFGKTIQDTTTGAQLANLPDVNTMTSAGVTWRCVNGVITATGTTTGTSSTSGVIDYSILGKVGTFYISGSTTNVSVYCAVTKNGNTAWYKDTSFTLDGTETQASIYCQVFQSGVSVNDTVYPMLNAGGTAKSWEPYTGGAASPNPEYPQELENAGIDGSIDLEILGGNLFNAKSLILMSNTTFDVSEDSYTITVVGGTKGGYCSSTLYVREDAVLACRGKTLHFRADSVTKAQASVSSGPQVTVHRNGKPASYIQMGSDNYVAIPVPEDATSLQIGIYSNNNGTKLDTDNEVVVKGLRLSLIDMDWSAYEPANIHNFSTPNGLPGIPVNQNGNYIDESGQQWICDEIDFGRGRHIHRVKVIELDGSEPWSSQSIPVENCYGIYLTKPDWGTPAAQFALMCSHFKVALSGTNGKSLNTCAYNGGLENFLINVDTTVCGSTLTEIKQWLKNQYDSGNPVTVNIALANPYETVLSAEELESFAELCTNYPSSTIYNVSGLGMEVSYNADTKNFIKNCIAEAMV